MMRIRLLPGPLLALLAAAPLTAQQPAAQNTAQVVPLDRIVAVVGDQPITMYDLQERMIQDAQARQEPMPTDSATIKSLEAQTLNTMIDEELLLAKAKELKIDVPDADLTNTVNREMKDVRSRFASENEFRTELLKAGLGTPEDYRKFLTDQLRRNQLIERVTRKLHEDGKMVPVNVTEAEVEAAFNANKDKLPQRPPSVTFRQIVIKPQPDSAEKAAAYAKADSILQELKKGANFEQLAKRESMDPGSKDLGGNLGWQRYDQYVPEFARWVWGPYALRPGDLSPVVETPFGYHIIRVDRVNGAQVQAHHILIAPRIDSADIARARLQADTVERLIKAGANFDTLAKKYHDYADKEETSLLTPFPRAQLPDTYQKAFEGKKPNDVVVFPIPGNIAGNLKAPKFVVAQLLTVDPGGPQTLADLRLRIRNQLAEAGGARRYLDALRKQTYVSVRLDTPVRTSSR